MNWKFQMSSQTLKVHFQRFEAPPSAFKPHVLIYREQKRKAKSTSRPLPKSKIFPFMELPAELRNMIYAYALTDPSGIKLVAAFKDRRRTVKRMSAFPERIPRMATGRGRASSTNNDVHAQKEECAPLVSSLLAVNKQIYKEGVDILYSNEFIFTDSAALYSFLINLGPASSKHLRTIRLMKWCFSRDSKAYNHSSFAVLIWATNLTTFHIEASPSRSWRGSPKRDAEQIYRNAFPWLEAVGAAKGKPDAAVDVLRLSDEFCMGGYYYGTVSSNAEIIEKFKARLSKLLGAQQKRLMARPMRKKKVSKVTVADEL
jgi:hypothetical protein